jgi:hypothetical protein
MKICKAICFLFILCLISPSLADAQQCPCCSPQHRQFDFWIGTWDVNNASGAKVGTNTISSTLNGCLITEKWVSESGNIGTSYNYFDVSDSTWNQVYIDNAGTVLLLKGHFINDEMILSSDLVKTSTNEYRNRITWSQDSTGNVTQLWEILDVNDSLLQVAFLGTYIRNSRPAMSEVTNKAANITVMEFVKILDNKRDEAIHFYENNWKVFREKALEMNYISSFNLHILNDDGDFDLLLITEFASQEEFALSEPRFQDIIKTTRPNGPVLLNQVNPDAFRQTVQVKTMIDVEN